MPFEAPDVVRSEGDPAITARGLGRIQDWALKTWQSLRVLENMVQGRDRLNSGPVFRGFPCVMMGFWVDNAATGTVRQTTVGPKGTLTGAQSGLVRGNAVQMLYAAQGFRMKSRDYFIAVNVQQNESSPGFVFNDGVQAYDGQGVTVAPRQTDRARFQAWDQSSGAEQDFLFLQRSFEFAIFGDWEPI